MDTEIHLSLTSSLDLQAALQVRRSHRHVDGAIGRRGVKGSPEILGTNLEDLVPVVVERDGLRRHGEDRLAAPVDNYEEGAAQIGQASLEIRQAIGVSFWRSCGLLVVASGRFAWS